MPGELAVDEALALADDIVGNDVPYVMLCGGEPLVVPHFFELAEALGRTRRTAEDRDQWADVRCRASRRGSRICRSGRSRSASMATARRSTSASGPADRSPSRTRRAARSGMPTCRSKSRLRRPGSISTKPSEVIERARVAGRLPVQYRQAHAHRHRGASLGQARTRRRAVSAVPRRPGTAAAG